MAAALPAIPVLLVVDDNDAKRYVTVRWLQRARFQVLEGSSGHEALALAPRADLLVLDVRLPDIDGFEVCRRLQQDPATAHVPILHLSAHATTARERAQGLEVGADAYLTQPVDEEELVATVRALLRIRRAEGALRVSEGRFRLAARATNDVLWDWELATDRVEWNQAAATLFRHAPAAIGQSSTWWMAQVHPDDRPRVLAGLRAVIDGQGELWTDEYRVRRGDGAWATVLDRGFVAHDERGTPVRMIGSMLDITERRRAEDALALLAAAGRELSGALDSEETLRRFTGFVLARVAEVCVVFGGPALHSPEEAPAELPDGRALEGRGPALRVLEAESVPARHAALRAGLRQGATLAALVEATAAAHPGGVLLATAGDAADALASAALLARLGLDSALLVPLAARGQALGTVLLGRGPDSLPFCAADLALATELASRAALAVDHALQYERAVIANRSKSDFLAVMSHELRTPLNAVLGYVDLLHLGIVGEQTPTASDYLQRVKFATRHLLGLIEQILLFSRMEAGREMVHPVPADAVVLAREAASLIEPLAHEKRLAFTVDVQGALAPDGGVPIVTDVDKTRQILLNLLGNAVKFTARGGVRLELRAEPHAVRIEVVDSGIGIATEHVERVFDPFWQVEQRKTRTAGGSGLGLTVSRRLARLLGGDLQVVSAPDVGSRFTLTLPRADAPGDRPVERTVARDTSGGVRAPGAPGERPRADMQPAG